MIFWKCVYKYISIRNHVISKGTYPKDEMIKLKMLIGYTVHYSFIEIQIEICFDILHSYNLHYQRMK